MSRFRWFFLLAGFLALAAAASPTRASAADEVIPPTDFGRKLPVGTYCPFPEIVSFTPPGASVVVFFDARLYVDDGSGNLEFTAQAIDNIVIAPSAEVAASTGPPAGDCQTCYVDDVEPFDDGSPPPVSCFYFNRPGPAFALRELFDGNPAGRGWDMTDAFFVNLPGYSAPRNPEGCSNATGGSLVLGHAVPAPSVDLTATTSIRVDGLTPGTSYDLTGWWDAGFTVFQNPQTLLTIRIQTPEGTSVALTSWGRLKAGAR